MNLLINFILIHSVHSHSWSSTWHYRIFRWNISYSTFPHLPHAHSPTDTATTKAATTAARRRQAMTKGQR